MRFEPRINQIYHLYESEDGTPQLSLIAPEEWTTDKTHLATVRLLADHTWEILESTEAGEKPLSPDAPA